MFKRKLKIFSDWLLLTTAGDALLFLALILFCLAIAGVALLVGYRSDPVYRYEKERIRQERIEQKNLPGPLIMVSTGMGLIGLTTVGRKRLR